MLNLLQFLTLNVIKFIRSLITKVISDFQTGFLFRVEKAGFRISVGGRKLPHCWHTVINLSGDIL